MPVKGRREERPFGAVHQGRCVYGSNCDGGIDLLEGKKRKPLIIEGARQVGKTCLSDLFSGDLTPERLITGLEIYADRKINPENTLLIFDEVQEAPRALSSLKYFYEDTPEYYIICAGLLLEGNQLFVESKGALTEQYVCQQLQTIADLRTHYYTNDRGSCEIDFVVDNGDRTIPAEVKAEINLPQRH